MPSSISAAVAVATMEAMQVQCANELLVINEEWATKDPDIFEVKTHITDYDRHRFIQDAEGLFAFTHLCVSRAEHIGKKLDYLHERMERGKQFAALSPRSKKAALLKMNEKADEAEGERMRAFHSEAAIMMRRKSMAIRLGVQLEDFEDEDDDDDSSGSGESAVLSNDSSSSMANTPKAFNATVVPAGTSNTPQLTTSGIVAQSSATSSPKHVVVLPAAFSAAHNATPEETPLGQKKVVSFDAVELESEASSGVLGDSDSTSPVLDAAIEEATSGNLPRHGLGWMTAAEKKRVEDAIVVHECQLEVQVNRCKVRCDAIKAFIDRARPVARSRLDVEHRRELKHYRERVLKAREESSKIGGNQELQAMMSRYAANMYEMGWGQEMTDRFLMWADVGND